MTDEFAFRRISMIAALVLPIQIEHHWQDIAASTPPPRCAYCFVAEAALRAASPVRFNSPKRKVDVLPPTGHYMVFPPF
jgi:hypothetical protein